MQNDDNSVSNLDKELLSVLCNLQNAECNKQHEIGKPIVTSKGLSIKTTITDKGSLQGSFYSKIVLNLSQKVSPEFEIQVFEKVLEPAPIQKPTNAAKVRKDIEDFFRRMRNR